MNSNSMAAVSPCLKCTRVKDPVNCENKHCGQWRKWFLRQWDQLRGYPRRMMDGPQPVLQEDPCSRCGSPADLCRVPCRARQAWIQGEGADKNEVESRSCGQAAQI